MFARTRDLHRLSERLGRLEDADRTDTIRALIRMVAESASREAQMARRISVLEAQAQELYLRLVEDAPVLTDRIDAGEAISEAVRG